MPKSPEELFAAALELTNPTERAALLDRECAGNATLRAEVESLLAAHEQASTFLNKSTVDPNVSLERPGDKIGHYKLREMVGEGGCGVVYVAEQEEPIRRRVALKVIKLGMDTKQVIARFEAERQALAMMDHPNIAKVLDAGTMENGRPYFVMELVRGIKITDYCDQNHLDTKQRLGLFIQVCNAVQHAHQKGIIHRDLKPSNILVTLHDGVPVPKVIDFGIAKATEGRLTNLTVYTELRQFIGTPAYMSPEQAEMSGLDIDTRSDIYALGVLLYELLTGKTPFDAKELLAAGLDQMRRIIREKEPVRPSTRLTQELVAASRQSAADSGEEDGGALPSRHYGQVEELIRLLRGDLDWIVMKCLEKDRTRRYETTNGLARDIERHLNNEPVIARPPSRIYRLQKFARRNRAAFAAVSAVAAVLVIATVISAWQAIRAMRAERHAQGEASRAQQAEKVSIEK
ncbi:MAG TPA: serine/threonine-protein kinase, partial [Gemmataceae bacterium]|nr:serine/threonine-protein kinase [Gemmataceae bacterium]